jgi:hypothetical protein
MSEGRIRRLRVGRRPRLLTFRDADGRGRIYLSINHANAACFHRHARGSSDRPRLPRACLSPRVSPSSEVAVFSNRDLKGAVTVCFSCEFQYATKQYAFSSVGPNVIVPMRARSRSFDPTTDTFTFNLWLAAPRSFLPAPSRHHSTDE